MKIEPIKVLLIEDSPSDVRLIREMLRKAGASRFDLVHANRLAAGLETLTREEIGLILLDLNLPDSQGLETFTRVHGRFDKVPIVVLTGITDEELATRAVREGAQDYLVKGELAGNLLVRAMHYAIERKRAEEALRESEKRFSDIADNALAWVWEVDAQGKFTYSSVTVKKILGYKPDEVINRHFYQFFHPDDREKLKNRAFESFAAKLPFRELINRNIHKNGQIVWLSTSGVPILDEKGNLLGYRGADLDITELKRAEEALSKNHRKLQKTAQRLEQSRNMLQLIIESIPVRVFWKDRDLRYLGCNALFSRDAGFSRPEQLLGLDDFAMGWREHAELYRADDRQVMESGLPKMNIVEPLTTPAGDKIWVNTSKVPLHMPNGEVFGVLGVYEDITARKRAEEALRVSEERYRSLVDNIDLGIALISSDYQVKMANTKHGKFFHKPVSELLGKECFREFEKREAVCPHCPGKIAMATGKEAEAEAEGVRDDGSPFVVHIHAFPSFGPNGEITGFIEVVQDITGRKRAEEALEKRLIALSRPLDDPAAIDFDELFNMEDIQHLQDQFAKATGVASIITHPDGTPITKPSNFCRLCIDIIRQTELGLKNCYYSDAIIGRHHPEGPIVQPCLSGGLWDAGASITVGGKHIANWLIGQVRNEVQSEENMREYARKIGANEEEFIKAFYEVTMMPESQFKQVADALFALANQLSAIAYQNVQQARFITERNKAEEERKKLEAQLIQAQKMEAIGTLAGGIAHDFNNILTAIIGYTELVKDELEEGTQISTYQQQVLKAAERARDLVKQILAFSRQDKQELKPIPITPVIKETLKFLRSSLPTIIEIRANLASDPGIVLANPTQIHQVLMNLCTNAAHAMREKGGILGVGLEKIDLPAHNLASYPDLSPGPYLRLTISDTGHGMDQEMVARIFEPFFTTKSQGEGTGMGLSVVHGIIKSYGGEIKVESEPGKGTTFQILLPQIEGEAIIKDNVLDQLPQGTERILLVDDEETLVEMGERILQRLGYRVVGKASSREALTVFEAQPDSFDLVITDQTMPQMTGAQLAQAILRIRPDIPIILCTGFSDTVTPEKIKAMGIRSLVMKPLIKSELAKVIREVFDGAAG